MATRVSVDEVQRRLDAGESILFVDSRNPQAWEDSEEKLPRAVRVPADEVDSSARHLSQRRPIVTYCTCPNDRSAQRTARRLEELGFDDVAILAGGMNAWIDAGYRTEYKMDLDEVTLVP